MKRKIPFTLLLLFVGVFSFSQSNDIRPKFRIGFDAPKIDHRQLLLTIDENTTDCIDWGYDAEIPQIFDDDMYWVLEGKKYVIQATNEIAVDKEIALGIRSVEGGAISIKVDTLENPIEGIVVYLLDKELNQVYDIQNNVYRITLPPGEYNDRFAITFKSEVIPDNNIQVVKSPGFVMYTNNDGTIHIRNTKLIQVNDITLFSLMGYEIQSWNTKLNEKYLSLPLNSVQDGVYIVRAATEKGNISKRILIK